MDDVLIYKFGGSCLKQVSDIEAIAKRIEEAPCKVVVVVSALNGVTDRILARLDHGTPESVPAFVASIEIAHLELSPTLVEPPFSALFSEAKRRLDAALLEHSTSKSIDSRTEALASGERMSSVAISAALRARGIEAEPAWSERAGIHIITSDDHDFIDVSKSGRKLALPNVDVPVVTGWYGLSDDGLALLGRGGSDLTATSLAAMLDAREVTIWRDVSGVLSLAPRWSLPSRNLPYLSYTEATELALFSEPMLHHSAVDPLRKEGIPLRLRPLHDAGARGTSIGPSVALDTPRVRAVGCLPRLIPISLQPSGVLSVAKVVADASAVLSRSRIKVWSISARPTNVRFLISERFAARAKRLLSEVPSLPSTTLGDPISLLCFVGEGIGIEQNIASQIELVSGESDIHITPLDEGRRTHALHYTVPAEQTHQALSVLADSLDLLAA